MKDHSIKPDFRIHVFGDWETVISVRGYRDRLLDQKPYDEDMARFSQYVIGEETAEGLFEAYSTFSERGLQCEIAVSLASPQLGARAYATTGTGHGSEPPWFGVISVG